MLLVALKSSNLRAASYEPWSATLTIEFHSGATYAYYSVPASVYDGLVASPSPGRFHHAFIRDRYQFQRIN